MTKSLKAAAVLTVAAIAPIAYGQYTGTSHPDQVPVTTSSEGISQPVVYEPQAPARVAVPTTPATTPALKIRTTADGMVVGDAMPSYQGDAAGAPVGTHVAAAGHTATEKDDAAMMRAEDAEYEGTAKRPDIDARVVMSLEGPANQLPEGTLLRVKIREQLSTTTTTPGQMFHAELTEPVEREGRVLLPAGTELTGRVTNVHGGKRISGAAMIHLQPMTLTLPDGTKYRVVGQVVDTDLYRSNKVDDEGSIVRKDHAGKTLSVLGLATGAGAAAGGMMAGVPGALVGAGVGAGVGTAVWLKQDRQTELPAGTRVVFALNEALTVGVQQ